MLWRNRVFKNWRINFVFFLILLFSAAIIGRLISIQIIQHDLYKALAHGQQNTFKPVKGERGQVFFKTGQILATNTVGNYVFVSPAEVEQKEKTAQALADILNMEKEAVLEKVNKDTLFEKLKDNLSEQETNALKNKEIQGAYVREANLRSYPYKETASKLIGFLGGKEAGQYGVEGFYNDILAGKEDFFDSGSSLKSYNGNDIFLTIDYNLQFMAEKLLKKAGEELSIEDGQIIVMDPNTGKVLAMAELGEFDPNNYFQIEDFNIFQNSATQKLFEPGSALKPITMAAALDQEKITPHTSYIDEGRVKIGKYVIENYNGRVFGKKTMTEVLEKSINTGAIFAERQVGHDAFLDYLDKFGLFDATGIDLQGEVYSKNKELKKGYEVNFATASFGQGIEITPIQLVRAFAVIANEGRLVRPHVAEKIIDSEGEVRKISPEISKEQVVSIDTVSKLTAMLVSVIENGYASSAKIDGYYIAAKTGTAQVPWSALGINKKGYSEKTWQSFIGFFPAFNPKFVLLVKLDNPRTNTAEYSAVPVFRQMAKYMIGYYSIPPDYE